MLLVRKINVTQQALMTAALVAHTDAASTATSEALAASRERFVRLGSSNNVAVANGRHVPA
jgi:hypothetical protein